MGMNAEQMFSICVPVRGDLVEYVLSIKPSLSCLVSTSARRQDREREDLSQSIQYHSRINDDFNFDSGQATQTRLRNPQTPFDRSSSPISDIMCDKVGAFQTQQRQLDL